MTEAEDFVKEAPEAQDGIKVISLTDLPGGNPTMVYLIVLLAVLARFIPHLPNFSPVFGALLFGGANLRKRDSIWFPLVLLGASDFVLTHVIYRMSIGWAELFQIAAFAAMTMMGWLLRPRVTLGRFSFACVAGPTAFYLLSNFGVWLGWHTYLPTWAGLVQCYVAGIPFYGYSLGSTFLFAGVLFGLYEFYRPRQAHNVRTQARTS